MTETLLAEISGGEAPIAQETILQRMLNCARTKRIKSLAGLLSQMPQRLKTVEHDGIAGRSRSYCIQKEQNGATSLYVDTFPKGEEFGTRLVFAFVDDGSADVVVGLGVAVTEYQTSDCLGVQATGRVYPAQHVDEREIPLREILSELRVAHQVLSATQD